jgi:2-iminobutanoate/2-iminopropanoate deaminase
MPVNRRRFLKGTGVTALGAAVAAQPIVAGAQAMSGPAKQAAPASKEKPAAPRAAQTASRARSTARRRKVQTDKAPRAVGPYSQAIVSGTTIYVAGQGPMNPKSGRIEVTTFEEQAVQTFENVKAIVEAAGSSLAKVLRVNVYLADLEDFNKMNEVYRRYFSADFPARTTIGAQLLLSMLIEVDCIASL